MDAEALHAAAQREYDVTRVQRDPAEKHVLELQQQVELTQQKLASEQAARAALEAELQDAMVAGAAGQVAAASAELQMLQQLQAAKQQLEQEHLAVAELQQQLREAQQLQRAAGVTIAHWQMQQFLTQEQLLLAQQHEHKHEQQLASTLHHLDAAAATAELAGQQLQQEGNKEHDPANGAKAEAQGAACASAAEVKLQQQLAKAQQQQLELQELLSAHQQLLAKLQEAASQATAAVAEEANTQQTSSQEERALLQQQLAAAQEQQQQMLQDLEDARSAAQAQQQQWAEVMAADRQIACDERQRLIQKLAASQAQVQEQQQALQEASVQAAQAAGAAQQQLQAAQREVEHMTELLALHESMLLRLQGLQQVAAAELPMQEAAASCHAQADTAVVRGATPVAAPPLAAAEQRTTNGAFAEGAQVEDGSDQQKAAAKQQLKAKYNEQVIQQLAAEVGRLLAEQATAEGLRNQLAAAAALNAALQAEVDQLSGSLDTLRQKAHQQEVAAHIASIRPTSPQAAARPQADAVGDAAHRVLQDGAHSQQQLLQDLEHEHANNCLKQLILQQQLHHAADEAAATAAQVAQLQAQLQASQECNAELRSQLQSMAATLADLEAAAAHSEIYDWPSSSQTGHAVRRPVAADHCQHQQDGKADGSAQPATALNAAAQAALIRGLSEAINKQAELQAQLDQRAEQVQTLTAQLRSTCDSHAVTGTQAQLLSMSGAEAAVLASVQEARELLVLGAEQHEPSSSAAAAANNSTRGHCDLVQELAALLAACRRVSIAAARGEGTDSTLAQEVAALLASSRSASAAVLPARATAASSRLPKSALAQEVAALLARSRRVSAAAAAAGGVCEPHEALSSKAATCEHSAASHSRAWGSDGGAAEQRTLSTISATAPCAEREGCRTSGHGDSREDAHLGTWGSVEGRLLSGNELGSNSRPAERSDEQRREGVQLAAAGATSAQHEDLWGTNYSTRPEVRGTKKGVILYEESCRHQLSNLALRTGSSPLVLGLEPCKKSWLSSPDSIIPTHVAPCCLFCRMRLPCSGPCPCVTGRWSNSGPRWQTATPSLQGRQHSCQSCRPSTQQHRTASLSCRLSCTCCVLSQRTGCLLPKQRSSLCRPSCRRGPRRQRQRQQ
jgi:hypothetical protein